MNETRLEELRAFVKDRLHEKRYAHTLGVESEALVLAEAMRLGEKEIFEIRTAAILHDVTKEWDAKEQLRYCGIMGIPCSGKWTPTIHARTGAYFARHFFPDEVNDTVFGAIYYHTTGRKDMTVAEKIICLADFTEPGRRYESCRQVRKELHDGLDPGNAEERIDRCLCRSFDMTIISLINKGAEIEADTFEARNYLIEKGAIKQYE